MKSLKALINQVMTGVSGRWWVPIIVGILILVFPVPTQAGPPVERVFQIEANRFAYSPPILKVNRGDRVTIELISTDVVHGFSLDDFGVEAEADPGQTARFSFLADRSGSFRFRCSVTCGELHPFMIGKIQVGENILWWRAAGLSILAVVAVLWRRNR